MGEEAKDEGGRNYLKAFLKKALTERICIYLLLVFLLEVIFNYSALVSGRLQLVLCGGKEIICDNSPE